MCACFREKSQIVSLSTFDQRELKKKKKKKLRKCVQCARKGKIKHSNIDLTEQNNVSKLKLSF